MGDIKTHAAIAEKIMRELKASRPSENYMFFELGNFLTDVSQFRDPAAHISGKSTIWREGRAKHWFLTLKLAEIDDYVDELMGVPGTHGRLAEWWKEIWFAVGLEKFRKLGIRAEDYEDIFQSAFTQYWPHEHLDFPPWPYRSVLGIRDPSDVDAHDCDKPPGEPNPAPASESCGMSVGGESGIRFVVKDKSGDLVPGVEFEILLPDNTRTKLATDNQGIIDITELPHGRCTLACSTQDLDLEQALAPVSMLDLRSAELPRGKAEGAPVEPPKQRRLRLVNVTSHKVKRGESIASIAATNGMTWQRLAFFNWGTTDRSKINAALKEKVGCTKRTADGQNYIFDDADEPGIVYIPRAWWLADLTTGQTHTIVTERVDSLPIGTLSPASDRDDSSESVSPPVPGKRKVLLYLEEQIVYLAELLTNVELEWSRLVRLSNSDNNRRERNRVLARFGHASHTIEDYFFHSNFVEIAWSREDDALRESEDNERTRRICYRRRRAPAEDKDEGVLSNSYAFDSRSIITGSFGSEDVFHTLMDALESNTRNFDALPEQLSGPLKSIASHGLRERLRKDEKRLPFLRRYREIAEDADTWIDAAVTAKKIHPKSGEALKRAFKIDNELFEEYKRWIFEVPETIRGPFAFFLEMVVQADEAHERSEARSFYLDQRNRGEGHLQESMRTGYAPTDNGASAENVGCHSLLAKDSHLKLPLRREAMRIATMVTCYIARLMVRRVEASRIAGSRFNAEAKDDHKRGAQTTVNRQGAIDWLHVLQHFLCHPDQAEHDWHIAAQRDEAAPDHHIVRSIDRATAVERAKMLKDGELRKKYSDLEVKGEEEWKTLSKWF